MSRQSDEQFKLRLPSELKAWAKDQADKERRTLTNYFVKMLEDKRNEETNHANRA